MALRSQFGKDWTIIWITPSFQVNSTSGGLLERIKVEATHRHYALRPIWLEFARLGHRQETNSVGLWTYFFSPCLLTLRFHRPYLISFIFHYFTPMFTNVTIEAQTQSVSGRAGIKTYLFLTWKLFSNVPYHFLWLFMSYLKDGWFGNPPQLSFSLLPQLIFLANCIS